MFSWTLQRSCRTGAEAVGDVSKHRQYGVIRIANGESESQSGAVKRGLKQTEGKPD